MSMRQPRDVDGQRLDHLRGHRVRKDPSATLVPPRPVSSWPRQAPPPDAQVRAGYLCGWDRGGAIVGGEHVRSRR
ncbi:hypothetical protein [Nocardia sp. NPDC059691]|uniref:hypothetical protein n=1 Tax=Nocardia sp. NPDC059691 TaxID=3346908 RepID=UPI00368855B1